MPKSRARIVDNDPLTPTDKVLDTFGQVSKSASQEPKKSVDRSDESNPSDLAAKKSTGQPVNQPASSKPNKSTSQPAKKSTSSSTKKVNRSTSQQSNQPATQPVESNPPTTEEASKSTSQQSDKSTSNKVKQPASQKQDPSTPTPTTEEVDRLTSQPVKPQPPRKATFQIEGGVLDNLERYHLQLLIDLGKRNAPYKETIVEEAIAQWLERAAKSPERSIKSLLDRQKQR